MHGVLCCVTCWCGSTCRELLAAALNTSQQLHTAGPFSTPAVVLRKAVYSVFPCMCSSKGGIFHHFAVGCCLVMAPAVLRWPLFAAGRQHARPGLSRPLHAVCFAVGQAPGQSLPDERLGAAPAEPSAAAVCSTGCLGAAAAVHGAAGGVGAGGGGAPGGAAQGEICGGE
jgi:hypothetical protein